MNYIKGDLLSVKRGIIIHGVNCQGVMGAGVAKAIRAKYPDVYTNYIRDIDLYEDCLGTVSWCYLYVGQSETRELAIASAFTQKYYGNDGEMYVSYDAINDCMDEIFDQARKLDMVVSMPVIGAGLGGGDWSIIEAIILSNAKKNNYPIENIAVYHL